MFIRFVACFAIAALVACGSDPKPRSEPDAGPDAGNEDLDSGADETDGGGDVECMDDTQCEDEERCEDGQCVAKPSTTTAVTIDAAFDLRARHFARWATLEARFTVSRDDEILFEGSTPVDDLDEEHLDATIHFEDMPLGEALAVRVELYAKDSALSVFLAAETVRTFEESAGMVVLGNADIVSGTFEDLLSYLFAGFPTGGSRCLESSDCAADLVCSALGSCVKPTDCKSTFTSVENASNSLLVECEPGRPATVTCDELGEGMGPLHCRDDCTVSLDWCGRECSQNWVACESDADCCSGACDHYCVPTLDWQRATELSPAGGWRRIAAAQTPGHYVSPRIRVSGDAGSAQRSTAYERLDFAATTPTIADSPPHLRASFSTGLYDFMAGAAGVWKVSDAFAALPLPSAHGAFNAITALLVYDDQGNAYPYQSSVGDGVAIREGVAINAATALPSTAPDYRDWVIGDDGTVALVSTTYPSTGALPITEVVLLRSAGADLYGVANLDDFAWAVGASGSVVRCDSIECEDVVIPGLPSVPLRDVTAVGKVLYMVGDAGTILSYAPDTGLFVDSSNPEYGNLVSVGSFPENSFRQPILVLSESGVIWQRPAPF
jgi:hypothetical protein